MFQSIEGGKIMATFAELQQARIAARQEELMEQERNRLDNIWARNKPLVENELKNFGITEIPEEIKKQMYTRGVRVAKVIVLPDVTEVTKIDFDKRDSRTQLPIATISDPALSVIAQSKAELKEKEQNANVVKRYFEKSRITFSEAMKNFIISVLPVKLPELFTIDGSEARVRRLIFKKDAVLHASEEVAAKLRSEDYKVGSLDSDEVFAVEHDRASGRTLTFFVREADYRKKFAKDLEIRLHISDGLAAEISEKLPHDFYYQVMDRYDDFEHFAIQMAKHARYPKNTETEVTVHDWYSGNELDIVPGADPDVYGINADDTQPCVIVKRQYVNVYVPKRFVLD